MQLTQTNYFGLGMERPQDGKVFKSKKFDRWRNDNVDLIKNILTKKNVGIQIT